MGLNFTETLTIEVPDVEEQIAAFEESEYQKTHGLIVEVAAIHEGMTANFNYYPAEALQESLESWVKPYPKPIIMNHDPTSEPVGRVVAAKMEKEDDGTPFVMLQVAITDPEAISKVVDQRYLTGSVGGSAKKANCSICGVDWAEASVRNIPCKHSRGKTYKGKLCYMEMNGIGFKEYSFVNMPADQRSSIRALRTQEEEEVVEDGWTRAARVFSLNMNDEEIVEFSESKSDSNVLEGMRKKDATPVYMQLKGAFLSALSLEEFSIESKDEELDVNTDIISEEEEDLLAVADGLSSDLADSTESEEEVEETASDKEEELEEDEEVSEEADASEDEETAEEEEAEKPEGQESPKDKDVDPDDSSGAPVSREDDEEEEVVTEEEEEETVAEEEEANEEDDNSEADLNEAVSTLESRVEELEAREQTLLEENTKLKAALKRNLAERVVDMKIALGLADAEERDGELEEHTKRSASSLADSLRDLAGMPKVQTSGVKPPLVQDESASIDEDDNSITVDDVTESEEEDEGNDPEDVFVDALMGRRKL